MRRPRSRSFLLRAGVILTLLCLAGAVPALAQRTLVISPPGIEPNKIRISADGAVVGFSVIEPYPSYMHLVRPDGSGHVVTGELRVSRQFWLSGDGRYLVSDRDLEIGLVDLQTGQRSVFTPPPLEPTLPVISDDAATITFSDGTYLYSVSSDGSNLTTIGPTTTDGTFFGYPGGGSMTSDGSIVAFDGYEAVPDISGVYRSDPDGSNLTMLADDNFPDHYFIRARISGDGSVVTFEDYLEGLWAVDADGSNLRPLITGVSGDYWGIGYDFQDLTTDGALAVYGCLQGVFVVNTDGSFLRQLSAARSIVDISGRGDVIIYRENIGGALALVSQGVPGVSPGPMIDLAFDADGQTLTWATRPSANAHNLYRASTTSPGALDPVAVGDCLQGGIVGASTMDAADPAPAEAFFYYVTGENGWGEGPSWPRPQGTERAPATSCPDIDTDGDAVVDALDGCPLLADPAQEDPDGDGINTPCDNCPGYSNPGQVSAFADANVGGLIGYIPDTVVVFPNGGEVLDIGAVVTLQWSTTRVCDLNAPVDILLSRSGPSGPFETLATGLPNTGSWDWTVTGPAVNSPSAVLRVVVTDVGPSVGSDDSDGAFRIR